MNFIYLFLYSCIYVYIYIKILVVTWSYRNAIFLFYLCFYEGYVLPYSLGVFSLQILHSKKLGGLDKVWGKDQECEILFPLYFIVFFLKPPVQVSGCLFGFYAGFVYCWEKLQS